MNKRFKTLRRVVITCPFDEAKQALDWAFNNGYHITSSGSKRLNIMKFSATTFRLVGEKEIIFGKS